MNNSSLCSTLRSRCFVQIYIQSRCFEWIIDSKAEFSYYKQWKRIENARAYCLLWVPEKCLRCLLTCLWLYWIPAHDITLTLHMILPCPCKWYYRVPVHDSTLTLRIILPCPCAWYYPVPAHDITLSLHMILPCPCKWYYRVPVHDSTLSLRMILHWSCTWYYPVPAHDITLSLHILSICWVPHLWHNRKTQPWRWLERNISKMHEFCVLVVNILLIILFINCNWVVTRWQWLFYM